MAKCSDVKMKWYWFFLIYLTVCVTLGFILNWLVFSRTDAPFWLIVPFSIVCAFAYPYVARSFRINPWG